ncbi:MULTISPECIES: ABC transporter permease [Streptomyces]|uniref:ABC transporter permease n=1 Tax=Streptomyces TaxID=1883 RepID=UPI001C308613|nr:ABC transporter permease [Streptomyces sp. GbtcB7]
MTGYNVLLKAHFRAAFRDRTTLFFTFAFPLVFIVVFGLLNSGKTLPDGRHYIDYIAPGVMSWGIGNGAVFGVAYTLVLWRRSDVLRLVRMTPTPALSVLASRLVLVLGVGLAQALLFLGVAVLPVFGLTLTATGAVLALPVVLLGALAFFAIGVLVGTVAKTPDAVAAIANCIMVPMAFLSGSFFPMSESPHWLQVFSRVLPLRYMNEGITNVLAGSHGAASLALPCAGLVAFATVLGALALRTFSWGDEA